MQNNNTFWKTGGRMKIYTYQGRKNVSGEKIRQMRNIKRMSQSDLAAKMQVEGVMLERDSISRIEGGERFVADYELRVFAKVLGVDVKWLLNEKEIRQNWITVRWYHSAKRVTESGVISNNIGLTCRILCKLLDIYVGNCYSIKKKGDRETLRG